MSISATTKTDLLQLGLLMDRPMHGYELYQQIQAEGIDGWFNISAAGVYYSLGKLRDQGLVAESGQSAGRSSRKSVYRLTEKGRTVFFDALEAELDNQDQTYLDYDLAVFFLNRLPVQRAIPQLQKHQAFLAGQAQEVEAALDAEQGNGSSPLGLAVLDHRRRYLEMEQGWLADVICTIQEESEVCYAEDATKRGLMRLSGDLGDYHLPDLVRLIVSGRHTGTLTATDGAEIRTLSFEDGQPVCASYLQRGEQPAPLTSCEQVLDGLCELFRWQEGRFAFDQRMVPQDSCVPIECSAEDLILRGCRKVDNWAIIQRLVPSSDTIFELGSAVQHMDRLRLTATEKQVSSAVDGVKDVAAIARDLDLTLFETSRAVYCLAAIGVLRTASMDKTRLRRVFREIAELMCNSTLAWRSDPNDRSCEEEVNNLVAHLPICIQDGRIQDRADPQVGVEDLQEMYSHFLQVQFAVISRRFGRSNARQAFERTLRQLAPELQGVAKRYNFDRLAADQ
jgi:DNA-binding PadR family transcriptional regulator